MWAQIAGAALGGLLGGQKHQQEVQQESRNRDLAANTQRYSPWTGLTAQPYKHAGSLLGDVASGALAGGMTASGMPSGGGIPGMPGKEEAPATMANPTQSSGNAWGAVLQQNQQPENMFQGGIAPQGRQQPLFMRS